MGGEGGEPGMDTINGLEILLLSTGTSGRVVLSFFSSFFLCRRSGAHTGRICNIHHY